MTHTARIALACGAALLLGGCPYTIKLDPGSEEANVYVNGDLTGNGIARHEVDSEFGFPDSFSAKVVTGTESYSVVIAREFETTRALYFVSQGLMTGGIFLATHFLTQNQPVTAENWPRVLVDPPWGLGFLGALAVAAAPLNLFQSFRYREYYDLARLRDQQKSAGKSD